VSFQINLKKNEQGTYDVTTTTPDTLPNEIQITGHVELGAQRANEQDQVVDLSVRASGIFASASRREHGLYMQ
jgi:hypothetical protein